MVMGKHWILKQNFDGMPKQEDFELVEEELPPLKDGEITFQALFLSVDPYMRPYTRSMKVPFTMIGSSVAKVVASKDSNFPVGGTILSNAGWIYAANINPAEANKKNPGTIRLAPDIKPLSESLLLGACGMPGNTAYFGLLELCDPKAGETVVVNGAAGAVGSLVGQIAKIKGCKVIGYAGTDEKVAWLKNALGFDHAFNYKTTKVDDTLKEGAPEGVDCFFDNVGGDDAAIVINHMNLRGRISVCGAISIYNDKVPPKVPATSGTFIVKQLKMEGFLVLRWANRWEEGITQMAEWIGAGKIKVEETVVDGFNKMPEAFIGLFTGKNTGKMIIKA